jgi:polysaccharide pyruvyl transferase WcaK-like protein
LLKDKLKIFVYSKMHDEIKVLVLGFYNRHNIGDDAYTLAFPYIFRNMNCEISVMCIDDIQEIPSGTDIVILGGGDLINDYFMQKATQLLKNFIGRVYGISIGLPYSSCTHYLHVFDHIFVRSRSDYELASREIGENNVTYIPDIASCLRVIEPATPKANTCTRLGVCLAQPLFYSNPRKTVLISSLSNVLCRLYENFNHNVEFHFIAFNCNTLSNKECDHIINTAVATALVAGGIPQEKIVFAHQYRDPESILNYINTTIDINLCMRYHSVVFSVITKTPFVPLYVSQKIRNLLIDLDLQEQFNNDMQYDTLFRPKAIDEDKLFTSLSSAFEFPNSQHYMNTSWGLTADMINDIQYVTLLSDKHKHILVRNKLLSFQDALAACQTSLSKYLHIDAARYNNLLTHPQSWVAFTDEKTLLQISRYICYIVSGQTNHPCVWGLSENLLRDDFVLYDAIQYIWEQCKTSFDAMERDHTYFTSLSSQTPRNMLINVDFIPANDFSQYHRAGWAYVIGGLMNFDALHLMRQSNVFLDTYVDRSFHWGYDVLKEIGIIPYTKPWFGFIHHVYDQTHSEYNCIELFKNEDFIASLMYCKGLLALSEHLAKQLRQSLLDINVSVPVFVVYHPMEFVPTESMFTMEKYLANPTKCVVQIGAWLRKPYAIYELPLTPSTGLHKVALKGKEMDQYFAPPNFLEIMENTLLRTDWYRNQNIESLSSNLNSQISSICRPCKRSSVNKYCDGLNEHIIENHNSVTVMDKLSNEEYDKLLSENIVFLQLVDCSAVNTVIECIVRNTIVIVNRLPALEELLGIYYPGFYTTLEDAQKILQDINSLYKCHKYLSLLDKTRYRLDHFLTRIQNIITNQMISGYDSVVATEDVNYSLFQERRKISLLPPSMHHLEDLARFFPARYVNNDEDILA